MVEFDVFVLTPFIGVLIGITVGLLGIWSNIKARSRQQREDMKASIEEVIIWTREYVHTKMDNMDVKVESVRNEMKQMHDMEAQDDRVMQFFTKWNQRIEDRIDRLHPEVEEE